MTENGSRGARRCLFGREDPERLSRDLADQVKKEEEASASAFEKKWNFKIENETPLPGRYEWERIDNEQNSGASTSRGLSHLPPSPVTDEPVKIVAKVPPDESSDTEKSSSEEKSNLSSSVVSESDISILSSAEEDINQNIVKESVKRKAPDTLSKEEAVETGAKRVKPP